MNTNNNYTNELSADELRELVPQLQQLTEKYKRAELVQKALFNIAELSGSVTELKSLFPKIHEIFNDFMLADNFFVALVDEQTNQCGFAYYVDQFDSRSAEDVQYDESHQLTEHIINTGEPLTFTDSCRDEVLANANICAKGELPLDLIGVPLKRGSKVIGALVVQTYNTHQRYSEDDTEVVSFASQHLVTAISRVKNRELTEQKIRERTRQLRQMNEELQEEIQERQKIEELHQALFEISELAASVDNEMEGFYSNIHLILGRLFSAPNCYIATYNDDNTKIDFPYFKDSSHAHASTRLLSNGLTEYVLRNGQAELIDAKKATELAENGHIDTDVAESMAKRSNSWLGSPLVVEGIVCGVIAVQTYGEASAYTPRDLELLRFVSHHIAVAIERKRNAESLQRYNQQLAEQVRERTNDLNTTNLYLTKQIEERKAIELKLIHEAHHDGLTGLPNRIMFNSRLDLAIATKQRHSNHNFAVLFIDLDRFKLINDTLGHHVGDLFLVDVTKRIEECVRAHDLVARLGGDEFVVLLDNFESNSVVQDVAQRIIDAVAAPFILEEKETYSGASIGIAYIESGYQSATEIIRDADAAMYQAKSSGRGKYIIFDASMREKLLEEVALENEFRRTLTDSNFECFAQPIVNLKSGEALYHECFVRWQHPNLGSIKRKQFWQVAEHSGLTIDLGLFLLKKVCKILRHWQKNPDTAANRLAVNLSVDHLVQDKLVEQLINAVENEGINTDLLVFEFDEHALNRKSQLLLPGLKKLKKLGITLVLDNFGSGLASLSYLYTYPFDFVKIDHRFIKSLQRSPRNLKMVESVKLISSSLNFELIANGVVNQHQLDDLLDIQCEYGQGALLEGAKHVFINEEQHEIEIA